MLSVKTFLFYWFNNFHQLNHFKPWQSVPLPDIVINSSKGIVWDSGKQWRGETLHKSLVTWVKDISHFSLCTGSFDRSVICHTPIISRQKCSLRLIFVEKSSLVHDIWRIYIPFNVMIPWKTSIDIQKTILFDECCKNT